MPALDNIDTCRDRLEADGFLVLDGICDVGFIADITRVCLDRSRAIQGELGDREIGIGSAAG